jgi:hypothetical protein
VQAPGSKPPAAMSLIGDDGGGTGIPTNGKSKKKRGIAELTDIWDDYVSGEEDIPKGPGGPKMDPRLKKVESQPCYRKDDIKREHKLVRCLGMKRGCTQTFTWPQQKARILSHASGRSYLATMGEEAPSVKLAKIQKKLEEGPKRGISDTTISSTPISSSGGNAGPPPKPGFKPSDSVPSVLALSRKAKAEQVTLQLDLSILEWIMVSGIPPTTVDLPQWKKLWKHANPLYTPASSSKLVDYHLPRECAHVRTKQLELLRKSYNLSITFDGNTTRSQESVYTFHIITPERQVYLFEGNSQSNKSHDANHLFSVVDEVSSIKKSINSLLKIPQQIMIQVGPERFNSICSDDTGSTHNTRGHTQTKYRCSTCQAHAIV